MIANTVKKRIRKKGYIFLLLKRQHAKKNKYFIAEKQKYR